MPGATDDFRVVAEDLQEPEGERRPFGDRPAVGNRPAELRAPAELRRRGPGLQERVCVVTGSTAGIGLETARLLVAEGARVVVSGRDPDPQ